MRTRLVVLLFLDHFVIIDNNKSNILKGNTGLSSSYFLTKHVLFEGKVFKKLDFNVPANIVNGIIMCKPGVIEIVLHNLRVKVMLMFS